MFIKRGCPASSERGKNVDRHGWVDGPRHAAAPNSLATADFANGVLLRPKMPEPRVLRRGYFVEKKRDRPVPPDVDCGLTARVVAGAAAVAAAEFGESAAGVGPVVDWIGGKLLDC